MDRYVDSHLGMNDTQTVTEVTEVTTNSGLTQLRMRVRNLWADLSRAERTVGTFLANCSPERLLYASAQELGADSGTSSATVVRTVQSLGYAGLQELKRDIATVFGSSVAPEVRLQQRIDHMGAGLADISDRVWAEASDRIALGAQTAQLDNLAAAVELLMRGELILTYGIGTSGIAASNLALRLNRIGRSARAVANDGFRLADDLLQLRGKDVVVVFAPGRVTRDAEVLMQRAATVGAAAILVTDEPDSRLGARASVLLLAPHTPTGMTSEALLSIIVSDILVQALASVDRELAVESSHQLTNLREELGY